MSDSTIATIIGSTARQVTHRQGRMIRTDDNGYIEVVSGTPSGTFLISGVAGDDTTINPFRQIDLIPSSRGWRMTLLAASQELGPLNPSDRTFHITPSVDAWFNARATAGGSANVGNLVGNGSTHLKGGSTYEYIPKTFVYLSFRKDTDSVDGYVAVSCVEG